MIHIHPLQLNEIVKKLEVKEAFSFTRYWDGEMACIVGRSGKNVDSCDYTDALREALRKTLKEVKPYYHAVFFPTWHRCTTNLRRQFEEYLAGINSPVKWFDAMVFQRAFESGSFSPIMKALKQRNCVFVGGKHLLLLKNLISIKEFIEIPQKNAFEDSARIKAVIRSICPGLDSPVVIFSAGMASNCVVDDLYGEVSATMIDMGSVWDAVLRLNTRIWMRKIQEHIIRRNIYG